MSKNTSPLKPNTALLAKLGSIIVHYEELTSSGGVPEDKIVIESLKTQEDVMEWFKQMEEKALLPVKRGDVSSSTEQSSG